MEYELAITITLTLLAALLMARGAWALSSDYRRWAGRRSQRQHARRADRRIRLLAKNRTNQEVIQALEEAARPAGSTSGAPSSPPTTTGPSSGRCE